MKLSLYQYSSRKSSFYFPFFFVSFLFSLCELCVKAFLFFFYSNRVVRIAFSGLPTMRIARCSASQRMRS